MKNILLSLTLAMAGILCLGGVAQAQHATVTITGEMVYPEHSQRLRDLCKWLQDVEGIVAHDYNVAQHSRSAVERARAAEYIAQYQRLHAEAVQLRAFLDAVPHTNLAEPHDLLSQAQWDDFIRMLRNNPNARGRGYVYDSRSNGTSAPNNASQPSQSARPAPAQILDIRPSGPNMFSDEFYR